MSEKCVCTPSGMEMSCEKCLPLMVGMLSKYTEVLSEFLTKVDALKNPRGFEKCLPCTRFFVDQAVETWISDIDHATASMDSSIKVGVLGGMMSVISQMSVRHGIPMDRVNDLVSRIVSRIKEAERNAS